MMEAAPARPRDTRLRDARPWQAATLAALLLANVAWLDMGASVAQAAVTVPAALLAQRVGGRLAGRDAAARRDWRSPLITGLSLSLLLRSHAPLVWCGAAAAGIGGKFVLRVNGKPLCNPACLGIVAVLLLCPGAAWVSPGQWGALAWGALALAGAAFLVLARAARADTALGFFGSTAALLAARCLALGDPWSIPLHQAQSGSLLIFGCFMITDPRSTPDARAGRLLFAALVAILAFALQFGWQVRSGLFFALVLAAPAVPVLDRLLPARRFAWNPTAQDATA